MATADATPFCTDRLIDQHAELDGPRGVFCAMGFQRSYVKNTNSLLSYHRKNSF